MLQRRFRIGYNRAARIVDEIEERGIIGPSDGSRPRQVLMSEDEYYGTSEEGSDQKDANQNEMNPKNIDKENITSTDSNAAIFLPEEENENNINEQYSGRFDEDNRKRGVDSFNSLPKSVQRMIMDADTEHADDKE